MFLRTRMKEELDDKMKNMTRLVEEKMAKVVETYDLKIKDLEKTVLKLSRSLTGVNRDLARKNEEIEHLKTHINRVEQKQKETRVRITGVGLALELSPHFSNYILYCNDIKMIFECLRYGLYEERHKNTYIYKKNEKWGANSKGAPSSAMMLDLFIFKVLTYTCFP